MDIIPRNIKTKVNGKLIHYRGDFEKFNSSDDWDLVFPLFSNFVQSCELYKGSEIHGRQPNFPEQISEAVICLIFGCHRKISKKGRFIIKPDFNIAFDVVTPEDNFSHKLIESKARGSLKVDLPSFSPRYMNIFVFSDYTISGKLDGSLSIKILHPNEVYDLKVNAKETFKDHQNVNRRPRKDFGDYLKSKSSVIECNIYDRPFNVCDINVFSKTNDEDIYRPLDFWEVNNDLLCNKNLIYPLTNEKK
jgi:hypothetical protein